MDEQHGQWQASCLPWHKAEFARLSQMRRDGRLPHAVLLTGAPASGKSLFAAALAASLLCREATEVACGQCESCLLARSGGHGDYRWLMPEEGKRAIGIDPVRAAIRFVQQTAGYGSVKVLVLTPAEALTTAAANALLKTLEEPAGSSHLLLVSDRPGDLPATVRSRCQTTVLPKPSQQEAIVWLCDASHQTEEQCARALRLANDGVLAALHLLASDGVREREALEEQLLAIMGGELGDAAAVMALSGYDTELVLESAANLIARRLSSLPAAGLMASQPAFDCHQRIGDWLSASRRGINFSRDLLLREFCLTLAGMTR